MYGLSIGVISYDLGWPWIVKFQVSDVTQRSELHWHVYQGQLYPSTEGPLVSQSFQNGRLAVKFVISWGWSWQHVSEILSDNTQL